MSGNNFEIKGLKEMINKINEADMFQLELQKLINRYGQKIINGAKRKTPVDSGQLRRSWTMEKGKLYVKIFNNTEYGIHVEYGHRTRGGKSYVQGVYMLKTTFEKEIKQFESDLEVLLEKYGFN